MSFSFRLFDDTKIRGFPVAWSAGDFIGKRLNLDDHPGKSRRDSVVAYHDTHPYVREYKRKGPDPFRNPDLRAGDASVSLPLVLDDLAVSVHRRLTDAGLVEPVIHIVSSRAVLFLHEVLFRRGEDEPPAAHRNAVADGVERLGHELPGDPVLLVAGEGLGIDDGLLPEFVRLAFLEILHRAGLVREGVQVDGLHCLDSLGLELGGWHCLSHGFSVFV